MSASGSVNNIPAHLTQQDIYRSPYNIILSRITWKLHRSRYNTKRQITTLLHHINPSCYPQAPPHAARKYLKAQRKMPKSQEQPNRTASKQPKPRSAEATVIPKHGVGRLLPPIAPGENRSSSNGRKSSFAALRKLARAESLDALIAIIGTYKRRDGKIDHNADGRVVRSSARDVIHIAYGDIPQYDPTMERPETVIDLAGMSLAERKKLLEVMDRITTVVSDVDRDDDDGPMFDGTRFSEEPPTIEGAPGETIVSPSPVQRGAYRPKPPPKVVKPPPKRPGPTKRDLVPGKLRKPRKNASSPKPAVSLFDADF